MEYTFDQLPQAVSSLHEKIDEIGRLLKTSPSGEPRDEGELLTIQQASIIINLSVATIYSKVSRKEIPVCKKGKRLYFSKAELVAWVRSGEQSKWEEIAQRSDERFTKIHRNRRR